MTRPTSPSPLLRQPEQGPVKRLGQVVLDDPEAVADIRAALEAAGVEFTNGDAPGVRLRKKR